MAEPSSSSKWQLKFRSGVEKVVGHHQAQQVDKLYEQYKSTGTASSVKFNDGTRVSVADLEAIIPVESDSFSANSADTFEKIAGYLEEGKSEERLTINQQWRKLIAENLKRLKQGKPWKYYKNENGGIVEISREEADQRMAEWRHRQEVRSGQWR